MGTLKKQENTLEKLFDMYERPMYYFALKITTDPCIAEDVVQDAFCKMIKYYESIKYTDDREIKSYLFAVIKTCAADSLRRNKIQESATNSLKSNVFYQEEDNPDLDFDIDKAIGEMSFDGSIGELVAKLTEEDQHILYLRYGSDASDKEIADILNLKTVESVRKRLSRAKFRLKNLLKANEKE